MERINEKVKITKQKGVVTPFWNYFHSLPHVYNKKKKENSCQMANKLCCHFYQLSTDSTLKIAYSVRKKSFDRSQSQSNLRETNLSKRYNICLTFRNKLMMDISH